MTQEKEQFAEVDFAGWSKAGLIQFAREANERMREDSALIASLREDCKAALKAYRNAVKNSSNDA